MRTRSVPGKNGAHHFFHSRAGAGRRARHRLAHPAAVAVGVTTDEAIEDVFRLTTLHGRAVLGMVANSDPDANRLKDYHGEPQKSRRRASADSCEGLRGLIFGSNERA